MKGRLMSRDTSKKASPDASSTFRLSAAKWTLILLFGPSVRRDPSFRTKLRVSAIPVAASKSARVRFGMINTAAAVEEAIAAKADNRSEERRVGKGCVRTCRYRWCAVH